MSITDTLPTHPIFTIEEQHTFKPLRFKTLGDRFNYFEKDHSRVAYSKDGDLTFFYQGDCIPPVGCKFTNDDEDTRVDINVALACMYVRDTTVVTKYRGHIISNAITNEAELRSALSILPSGTIWFVRPDIAKGYSVGKYKIHGLTDGYGADLETAVLHLTHMMNCGLLHRTRESAETMANALNAVKTDLRFKEEPYPSLEAFTKTK